MDRSRPGVTAGALAVGSTLAGATGNRIYGDSKVCNSEDCRVTEKPERIGRHSIVIVKPSGQPSQKEQYHLACIPTELLSLMQRSCSISKQEKLTRIRVGNSVPLEIDACKEGDKEALQLLLEHDCLTSNKEDLAILAASERQHDCLALLLDNGANINTPNIDTGKTLLCQATLDGDSECIKLLLKKGADANISDNDGNTALHLAAQSGQTDSVKAFLNNMEPESLLKLLQKENNHRNRAFHLAAQNGQTDSVKAILNIDNRIDPWHIFQLAFRFKNKKENKTARDLAIQNGHREVAEACRGFLAKYLKIALFLDPINNMNFAKRVVGIDHSLARDTDNNGNTALHQAAESGRTDIVKAWLAIDSSLVEETNRDGNTALHLAAQNGHTDTVREFPASPRIETGKTNRDGNTALHLAAQNGHTDTVQEFLASPRIEPGETNRDGNTALHLAAQNGHTDTVQAFLESGKIVVWLNKNNDGNTALHLAAKNGHKDSIPIFLDPKKRLGPKCEDANKSDYDWVLANEKNKDGKTAFQLAAQNGHTGTVRAFLDLNDIKEFNDFFGYIHKAYLEAAQNKHRETATALRSPLFHLAAKNGDTELVLKLLKIDESLADSPNKDGNIALHIAALESRTETVKALLDFEPCLAKETNILDGTTPLHHAAKGGGGECLSKECLELIIGKGADINATDDFGRTALHNAAELGYSGCVKLLLDEGADINATDVTDVPDDTDDTGYTPLHYAAESGYSGCVKLLLHAKAEIKADCGGQTPLHCATGGVEKEEFVGKESRLECVKLLTEAGADINATFKGNGHTPLINAVEANLVGCVKFLLDKGADLKADSVGMSPLHHACDQGGNQYLVGLLIEKKRAGIDAADYLGRTALHIAVVSKNRECVKLLLEGRSNYNYKQ